MRDIDRDDGGDEFLAYMKDNKKRQRIEDYGSHGKLGQTIKDKSRKLPEGI